jgi:hypothetical protein
MINMSKQALRAALPLFLVLPAIPSLAAPLECTNWQSAHPEWLWCDDFESDAQLEQDYFEVSRQGGHFGVSGETAFGGNGALKGTYIPGESSAGNVKFSFGRSKVAPTRYSNRDFEEVYWRFYIKMEQGFSGNPNKITRGIVFNDNDWSQASIGHLWEGDAAGTGLDPVSGVVGSQVVTTQYNDFENMSWLGHKNGVTRIYAPENNNRWFCVEVRMKLNTPGQSDGVFEYWIDSKLEASQTALNWRGNYTQYGINAIFLENYQNSGPSKMQSRYFDNFVVSEQRIGCFGGAAPQASDAAPKPPGVGLSIVTE